MHSAPKCSLNVRKEKNINPDNHCLYFIHRYPCFYSFHHLNAKKHSYPYDLLILPHINYIENVPGLVIISYIRNIKGWQPSFSHDSVKVSSNLGKVANGAVGNRRWVAACCISLNITSLPRMSNWIFSLKRPGCYSHYVC